MSDFDGRHERPERIGNCRILGEVGVGGMAVVYRALQEPLNRNVAIKALKPEVAADEQLMVRFRREALFVASLQHENIVQIYDFVAGDPSEHGTPGEAYIVMEFVDGIDLFDLLERAPRLPAEVAAIVAVQVARALDHAHFRGVIHRDIKPANVMIGRNGAVKLMDFGIARDEAVGDLTKDGMGVGTPSYMSPEQALGDKLDFRSDLFGLGIVLYQMVCGRKPFVEDDHRSVMQKIRSEKPIPPRRLNATIPRELERIILTCLEKRREDRYRSTQDLVFALERFIAQRCRMNHRARLVVFLREKGVLGDEEADRYLRPTLSGGFRQAQSTLQGRRSSFDPRRRLWRLAGGRRGWRRTAILASPAVAGAMLLALGLWIHGAATAKGTVGASHSSSDSEVIAPDRGAGYLKLLVDGSGDVLVDGKMVEHARLARPVTLAEGRHRVELRGATAGEARFVQIQRGATQTLRLTPRTRAP